MIKNNDNLNRKRGYPNRLKIVITHFIYEKSSFEKGNLISDSNRND